MTTMSTLARRSRPGVAESVEPLALRFNAWLLVEAMGDNLAHAGGGAFPAPEVAQQLAANAGEWLGHAREPNMNTAAIELGVRVNTLRYRVQCAVARYELDPGDATKGLRYSYSCGGNPGRQRPAIWAFTSTAAARRRSADGCRRGRG